MSGIAKIVGAVEFWVAVVAATASIAAAFISRPDSPQTLPQPIQQQGAAANSSQPAASVDCLGLIERTRAWANAYPRDAARYAADSDADAQGLPSLWSLEARKSCAADPELLLEAP